MNTEKAGILMGLGGVGPSGDSKEDVAPLKGSNLLSPSYAPSSPQLCPQGNRLFLWPLFANVFEPALSGASVSWQCGWQTPVGAVQKGHL